MVIKIGDIEFQVVLADPEESLMNLTVRDALKRLRGASVSVFLPPALGPTSKPEPIPELVTTREFSKPALATLPPKTKIPDALQFVALLKEIGFTAHTIVMILKKVLRIKVKQEALVKDFHIYYEPVINWLDRKLNHEDIWAIYIAPISVNKLGQIFVACGLNRENQFVILGIEKATAPLYKSLVTRGLNTSKIEFGMLSLHAGPMNEFKKVFSKAQLARDWKEVAEMVDDENIQEDIQTAMMASDETQAKRIVKKYKLPQELLTYYEFDPKLWRVLRTATMMPKLERELRSSTRMKQIKTEEQLQYIKAFTLVRIQYYWIKTPVDSQNLLHLRSVAKAVEAINE